MLRDDAGYATAVAMVIGLALSIVTAATITRSLAELRLADQSFAKAQTELELAAAHNAAALALATTSKPPPYRWVVPVLGKAVEVVAEPEFPKLNVRAAGVDDAALAAFQVTDGSELNQRLGRYADRTAFSWLSEDDASPVWRACAATFVSPFGGRGTITPVQYSDPDAGKTRPMWRSGEVWRVVAAEGDGWHDERLVRFTGDETEPFAIIQRRVQKGRGGTPRCETLFG